MSQDFNRRCSNPFDRDAERNVIPLNYSKGSQSTPYELRNVGYTDQAGRRLLRNIWLRAERDTITCIVGSTKRDQNSLVKVMSGLAQPSEGSVLLDGIPLGMLPSDTVRSEIALVMSEPWIARASIADNIGLGHPEKGPEAIAQAAKLAELDSFLEFLPDGLETIVVADNQATTLETTGKADKATTEQDGEEGEEGGIVIDLRRSFARRAAGDFGSPITLDRDPTAADKLINQPVTAGVHRLTLAQRRRIAIAQALLQDPKVIIVEEPTTGLDPTEERLTIGLLDRIAKGRVVIVASHHLNLARRADRVLVIDNGRLTPYGKSRNGKDTSDHNNLWGLAFPPVEVPGPPLRLVKSNVARTRSKPWGIEAGTQIAPGHVAGRLVARTEHNDVWAAWSEKGQRPVRVKVPRSVPVTYRCYEELSREYRALSKLNHPGLSNVYGADLEAEMPYVVHEFLDSHSLEAIVDHKGSGLDPLDVLFIGFELAGALNYLHKRDYAHLNLRPRHLRTRADTIVIADFTHIRPLGDRIPSPSGSGNGRRGEHIWFAPEQTPGQTVTQKMDIYTLGVLLHFLTAGSLQVEPAATGLVPVSYRRLVDEAPSALVETIPLMLAADPVDRPDAEEVLRRFRRSLPASMFRPRLSEMEPPDPRLRVVGSNN